MIVWRMVADECIMPMRHDYLMNHGLASVMQHAGEKVLSTCMRVVLPDAVSRLIGELLRNSYTSNTCSASHSGTSTYTHGSTCSCCSPSQYFHFGCNTDAHDLHFSLWESASCICSCWHGDRCVPVLNFSTPTSWF